MSQSRAAFLPAAHAALLICKASRPSSLAAFAAALYARLWTHFRVMFWPAGADLAAAGTEVPVALVLLLQMAFANLEPVSMDTVRSNFLPGPMDRIVPSLYEYVKRLYIVIVV